jgi:glycosyltransferase involved in cell wall biosynthesis
MNKQMKKRPLRILYLTASVSVGGAERMLLCLAKQIHSAGLPSHILVFNNRNEADSLLPQFQALDLPFHHITLNRFYDPRVIRAITDYTRQHQIELIHTHLADADIVGKVVGQRLRIPVISTLHTIPQGYENAAFHRRWPIRFTTRNLATHLIAVSEEIRRQFIARWRIPSRRISTIYNGVDMETFLSITEGTKKNSPFVITNIGSLTPQKAQHVLLDAAKLVLARQPQTQFLIVGRGALAQDLAARARGLGIADRVEFTGLRQDVPQILADSDIFVLSSLREGMSLAAIEAMAAARPVVLTDVGGNPELVEAGVQGLIVPSGDAAALAEALLTLREDPSRRTGIGRAARARVRDVFSLETMTRQYEELYRQIWTQYHE